MQRPSPERSRCRKAAPGAVRPLRSPGKKHRQARSSVIGGAGRADPSPAEGAGFEVVHFVNKHTRSATELTENCRRILRRAPGARSVRDAHILGDLCGKNLLRFFDCATSKSATSRYVERYRLCNYVSAEANTTKTFGRGLIRSGRADDVTRRRSAPGRRERTGTPSLRSLLRS